MKILYILAIIIGILLLLFLLLSILKLTIYVRYYHKKDNDDLTIEIRLFFGLIKFRKKIPLIKIDDNSPTIVVKDETEMGNSEEPLKEDTKQFGTNDIVNMLSNTKEILKHVVHFHRIIKFFFSKLTIKNIEWSTIVGLGDAAHTGMVSGAIWAGKGSVIGIISSYMKLANMPKINIYPQFQGIASETLFTCMIQFRLGHAMMAGIKLVKYWKGGFPNLKTNEASIQK